MRRKGPDARPSDKYGNISRLATVQGSAEENGIAVSDVGMTFIDEEGKNQCAIIGKLVAHLLSLCNCKCGPCVERMDRNAMRGSQRAGRFRPAF